MKKFWIGLLACAALVAPGFAATFEPEADEKPTGRTQDQGEVDRRQPGQGSPARPGARNNMPGFFMLTYKSQLVLRQDVRDELGIDREMLMQIGRAMMEHMPRDMKPSGDPKGQIKRQFLNQDDAVDKLLTKEQRDRLHQIWIQFNGSLVASDFNTGKALQLTQAQQDQIDTIIKDLDKIAKAEADKRASGQPLTGENTMIKAREEAKAKVDKILSDAQRAALEQMGGEKFKFMTTQDRIR